MIKGTSRAILFAALAALWLHAVVSAQAPQTPKPAVAVPELRLDTGKEIFEAACIGCHGPGGRGQPRPRSASSRPRHFPTSPTATAAHASASATGSATIHEGGPGRGFSEIMPSFAEALTHPADRAGHDLPAHALPRTCLAAGRVESAARSDYRKGVSRRRVRVMTMSANATGSGAISSALIYEKRFGVKNQLEIAAPLQFHVARRRRLGRRRRRPDRRLQAGACPQQPDRIDLQRPGRGEHAHRRSRKGPRLRRDDLRSLRAFGQILPRSSFLQIQTGAEFPTDTEKAPRAVYLYGPRSARASLRTGASEAAGRRWSRSSRIGTRRRRRKPTGMSSCKYRSR